MNKFFLLFLLIALFCIPSLQYQLSIHSNHQSVTNQQNISDHGNVTNHQYKLSSSYPKVLINDTSVAPVINDGFIDPMWNDVTPLNLTFYLNGTIPLTVELYALHDSNYVYFAYKYYDATANNDTTQTGFDNTVMIMDTKTTDTAFNEYGGSLFDEVTQGFYTSTLKSASFDRSLISSNGASITVNTDTNVGGYNNVLVSATYNFTSHTYFNVIAQELHGNDTANDINYAVGDHFLAMPGVYVDNNAYSYIGPVVNFTLAQATPKITIQNPVNGYSTTATNLLVNFTVNQGTSWIGYSLDGQTNQTVTGNFSLTSLNVGSHTLVVYANNTFGKMGESIAMNFSIDSPKANTTTTTTNTTSANTSTSSTANSSTLNLNTSNSENSNGESISTKSTAGFTTVIMVLSSCAMILYKRKKKF